jgi:hypothetical protein
MLKYETPPLEVFHTSRRNVTVLPCIASRMDKLIEQGHGAMDASVIGFDAVKPL